MFAGRFLIQGVSEYLDTKPSILDNGSEVCRQNACNRFAFRFCRITLLIAI